MATSPDPFRINYTIGPEPESLDIDPEILKKVEDDFTREMLRQETEAVRNYGKIIGPPKRQPPVCD